MVAKAPIYKLSRSKAPKAQLDECLKHPRKTSDFLVATSRKRNVSARKNAAYLGSRAKVSVLVQSIIFCYTHW